MRKHDVRKWIHAVLDMLPLVLIPVFMVFSHRHDIAEDVSYTEEAPIYYQTNDINSSNDFQIGRVYTWSDDFSLSSSPSTLVFFDVEVLSSYLTGRTGYIYLDFNGHLYFRADSYIVIDNLKFDFLVTGISSGLNDIPNYILEKFTSCENLYIKEYQEVVVTIPQDVMDSFINQMYYAVDKYFNFNSVGNFNDVYEWLSSTFFNGNVPTSAYIVWNIILYEFIMDVLFLIYAVFMFIIDFVECLIDKAFGKSYRGGR